MTFHVPHPPRVRLRRAMAFLAAFATLITASASPAQASPAQPSAAQALVAQAFAANPLECAILAGDIDLDNYLGVCAIAEVTRPGGRTHVRLISEVYTGTKFKTAAVRCAVSIYGQFQGASGAPWDIPQAGRVCTDVLTADGYSSNVHLESDTTAIRARLNLCTYWYYNGSPTNTICFTGGVWQSFA